MNDLSAISKQASAVLTDVRNGRGSLGKFMVDPTAYNHLNASLENVDHMLADVQAGKGTLGKLIASDEMYNHVNSVAGRVDNVLEAVQEQKGTLGKLVYDTSFHDSAKKSIDNGNGFVDGRAGRARATLRESSRPTIRCLHAVQTGGRKSF